MPHTLGTDPAVCAWKGGFLHPERPGGASFSNGAIWAISPFTAGLGSPSPLLAAGRFHISISGETIGRSMLKIYQLKNNKERMKNVQTVFELGMGEKDRAGICIRQRHHLRRGILIQQHPDGSFTSGRCPSDHRVILLLTGLVGRRIAPLVLGSTPCTKAVSGPSWRLWLSWPSGLK